MKMEKNKWQEKLKMEVITMPYFEKRSKENLETCHPDLQKLFNEVLRILTAV